ncbi:MAG: protein kinase [Acidobacteriota bacterium]
MIGTSLGPYKILEPLGAGGMGEVYLAEDTRLVRKVAVKVLPEEFAADPERLARFEQEARAAAALNHPHIAAVFDVGFAADAGAPDGGAEPGATSAPDAATGVHYMVQEYLTGQSLRQRLDRGALPLARALDLAAEVGEALVAAHKAGIIHRDLKPDNIFVSEDGHAKVLDFGLAKLTEMAAPMSPGTSAGTAFAGVSKSPTVLGTVAGQIMGTAGYMAPEQIHGDGNIDRRADLFAFGCVLYEMVSGRQPFAGKSMLDTLHRIADEEPASLHDLPVALPAQLHWIIRKCLAKDPARRYQDADDLVVDLKALAADVESGAASAERPAAAETAVAERRGVPIKVALPTALVIALLAVFAGWFLSGTAPPSAPLSAFAIDISELGPISAGGGQAVAISPDGEHIVVRAEAGLYHRPIDRLEFTLLPGTGGGLRPAFSPNGEWIVFTRGGKLYKVSLSGGEPFELCEAPGSAYPDWGDDDTIIFVGERALYTVPAAGGDPKLTAEPDSEKGIESYYRPSWLPGSKAVLVEVERADGRIAIGVLSLDSGEVREIAAEGTDPAYVPTGHVVYARGATLFAVPFDAQRLEALGEPTPVLQGVRTEGGGATQIGFSDNGTLIYLSGEAGDATASIVWVDRQGGVEALPFESAQFGQPRLSPDGERVAATTYADENQIWIYDVAVGTSQRLTFEGSNRDPVWSPDGEWIYFTSDRSGDFAIWRKPARRRGDAEPVLQQEGSQFPYSISQDGSRLFYTTDASEIAMLPLGDEPTSVTLVQSAGRVSNPAISPDGSFVAFQSDESGRVEIVVLELSSGEYRTVSNSGGRNPVWSRDGKRLFYSTSGVTSGGVLVADVTTDGGLSFSRPVPFIEASGGGDFDVGAYFDVSLSGDRLLAVARDDLSAVRAAAQVNVVLNWFEELKQRVPTAGSR